MMRIQLRPFTGFTSDAPPLEGEAFWDAENRLIGVYNTEGGDVDWFRLPRSSEGESLSYIPKHEIEESANRIRFQNADGEWGNWLVSPRGAPGLPNTLTKGTFEIVDDASLAGFTITGEAPNQVLNIKLPRGATGNAGYLPVASVQMMPPGSPARFVNIGTSQAPSYKLELPYYSTPIEYGAVFENTNGTVLSVGEYILTRYAPVAMTIKKLIADVLSSSGSFECSLYIDGVLKSTDLYCSEAYATNLTLNVPVQAGQAISVVLNNITTVSSAWVQVIGEP